MTGTLIEDTKSIRQYVLDECVQYLEKFARLRYLGQVEVSSEKFQYVRNRYSEERKWHWENADPQEAAKSRHLFFALYGKSILVEVHLEETYDYNRFMIERGEVPPPWSRYWHIILRGIVPWAAVEKTESSPMGQALHMLGHGCDWDNVNPQPMLHGRSPLGGGDLQMVSEDFEFSHAFSSNGKGGSWRVEWTEETLSRHIALVVASLLLKTRLTEYAVPSPIPHLQYVLPEPKAFFRYDGCAEYFWSRYPIESLMKYCDEKVCRPEYEAWVGRATSEWYRSFRTS